MCDGSNYGLSWQKAVGWIESELPTDQVAPLPLVEVARKLAYYMGSAAHYGTVGKHANPEQLPRDYFHRHESGRGTHTCELAGCDMQLGGVFGFRNWKFPTGIVHYILDHNWIPPREFLDDLNALPDPPQHFSVDAWVAPNRAGLFQRW